MKIVVAPDSFKGCCTAVEASRAIAQGIAAVFPQAGIVRLPAADGGEGTAEALLSALGGVKKTANVTGPLGDPVAAAFAILPDGTAVIETASASGLPLVPREKLNPLLATSRGTGELIRAALDEGCRKFLIGLGGSATNDAGMGMAQALGVSFSDAAGRELGPGGVGLERLARIDASRLDARLSQSRFTALCDVRNTLCGPDGASAVYGPQKGATPETIARLDAALYRFAQIARRDLGRDILDVPGCGAAGGLGAALPLFCGAQIQSGIDTVLDLIRFDAHMSGCDLVITGEGSIDGQSAYGKVPAGVARRAKRHGGIPVAAVVGAMKPGAEKVYKYGIDVIMPTATGPMTLGESIARAPELLSGAAERLMRIVRMTLKHVHLSTEQ
ncbi:MAG: glycerate kinase [Pyramidobacter porci]|uniref:glycerate kinase n=1 Tax=Pyramidobacter porci TaxID=2605789 RepID=UPI002A755E73|nr:glycerate kinase [Pyramidobacter porci]MDY2648835.1 glycerate kinase [Pyramidobacter porci]